MSNAEAREELASIAASLRAYLEWHVDSGSAGIPRRPREARAAVVPAPRPEPEVIAAPPPSEPAAPSPRPAATPPAQVEAPRAPLPPITLEAERPLPVSAPKPAAAKAIERAPAAPPRPLDVIQAEVASCTKCGLHATRTNTVFFRGNPAAQLCFIGEAPGADEDAQGKPFVGRAGQLLDKMIVAMGLDPENDVYVCNIVKCRPPGNRKPEPDETSSCIPYLHEQLANVQPKVIVALGNTSVAALLGSTLGITKVRGSWKLYRGKIPVMPTYHPSYLLRPSAQQAEAKRQVWEDLQAVMKELGLTSPARKQ